MSVKTEGQHAEEFLVSEGEGTISREKVTLASGQSVIDGQMLKDNGSGKAIAATGSHDTAGDSDEDLLGFVSGTWDVSVDTPVVVIARLAEVKSALVKLHTTTGGGAAAATAAIVGALPGMFLVRR